VWKGREPQVTPGSLFSELRRRRVWRVAGAYVLVVWMAVEIVLETFPLFGFPDWVSRVVVVAAFVGFPVTVILAWAFDTSPAGGDRTPPLPATDVGADAPRVPERVVVQPAPARLAGVFGAGILVALVGFGAYSVINPSALVRPESIQALAVLPFSDLSASQDQSYFADGVTEELINRLAQLGDIRVVGRTSSFALRDEDAGIEEIARRLNVDAVVEGSIRRSGDQLRVTVELVDVKSGFQVWSQSYDRTVDDIFVIQDEISAAIVDALRLQLVPGTSRIRTGTGDLRAHDAYLLGLARWHGRTETDLVRALEYFEEAIEHDDSYAPAHAGLALTYAVLPAYSDIPADVAAERGSEAAARALALDARLAEGHAAIGQIAQGLEWNLDAAEMAYRLAIEFQPSYGTAHHWYGEALIMLGRLAEAERELQTALTLDPLSVAARNAMAYLRTVQRDYPAALEAYGSLLADAPAYVLAHAGRVLLCLEADCHEEAMASAAAGFPPDVAAAIRAVIRADADPALIQEALDALDGIDGRLDPAQVALLLSALDQREQALEAVERAYAEEADPNLPFLLVHPLFDPIRADPRFGAIVDGLGVEAPTARVRR
jgi:TolB-like protein/Flp pilus assembly protein TadD